MYILSLNKQDHFTAVPSPPAPGLEVRRVVIGEAGRTFFRWEGAPTTLSAQANTGERKEKVMVL